MAGDISQESRVSRTKGCGRIKEGSMRFRGIGHSEAASESGKGAKCGACIVLNSVPTDTRDDSPSFLPRRQNKLFGR